MDEAVSLLDLLCESEGDRLDHYVSEKLELSRSRVVLLIEDGLIHVNGIKRNKNYRLSLNDQISVSLPPEQEIDAKPENIPLNVVYEDNHIIVIHKPQ